MVTTLYAEKPFIIGRGREKINTERRTMKQGITHRANTARNEYVKLNGRWFKLVYQTLPVFREELEPVGKLSMITYLEHIAYPVSQIEESTVNSGV